MKSYRSSLACFLRLKENCIVVSTAEKMMKEVAGICLICLKLCVIGKYWLDTWKNHEQK